MHLLKWTVVHKCDVIINVRVFKATQDLAVFAAAAMLPPPGIFKKMSFSNRLLVPFLCIWGINKTTDLSSEKPWDARKQWQKCKARTITQARRQGDKTGNGCQRHLPPRGMCVLGGVRGQYCTFSFCCCCCSGCIAAAAATSNCAGCLRILP